jgi:tRNA-modifying protein YgfZ
MPETDMRNNPLAGYLESIGFKPFSSNGRLVFTEYSGVAAELETLHKGAGLHNLSGSGIIELKGKDVLDFLHRITTNSLKDLPKESIGYTIFTSEKGRIIDTAAIVNFGDYQLMICSHEQKQMVISWINKYVISDDVQVVDTSGKYVLLELLGPQADSFITLVCGDVACKLAYNTFKVVNTDGMLFFIMHLQDAYGGSKYWLLADQENGLKLIRYMVDNKGPFNFNLIGETAYNIYRIEAGVPAAPAELNYKYNPHEAKLLDMVSFTKGCYIGQEVIARLDTYNKVQKYISGITFKGGIDTSIEYGLFDNYNEDAGTVTSAVYSEKMGSFIGLAYVKKQYAAAGTELTAKSEGSGAVKVIVTELPFTKK